MRNKIYTNDSLIFNYNPNYSPPKDLEIYLNSTYKV